MVDRAAKDALYESFADVARALASGRRAEIVDLLAQGERPVEQIAAEIGQSVANTSHRTCGHWPGPGWCGPGGRAPGSSTPWPATGSVSLWSAMRDVATEHVAGLDRLAEAFLGRRDGIEEVGREELAARLARGEVVLLDVRPTAEYAAGHITGARSVPVGELHRYLSALPADADVVAYCRGPYCVRADEAVRELSRRGMRAQRLADGFPEWKRAGLPVAGVPEES